MRHLIDLITESQHEHPDVSSVESLADFIVHGRPHEEILDEASPRASAVTKPELPAKYRKLPVLGRGMTSIVLEKDPETALIFTRDQMKLEYMRDTGIAKVVDSYTSHNNPVRGIHEYEIYVLEMPKLFKLQGSNVGLVKKLIKEWNDTLSKKGGWGKNNAAVEETIRHFSADENHALEPVWSFLVNYDASQFIMDFGTRQFLQTKDGLIVCVDPIVARDLLKLLDDHHAAKYREREDQRGGGRYW